MSWSIRKELFSSVLPKHGKRRIISALKGYLCLRGWPGLGLWLAQRPTPNRGTARRAAGTAAHLHRAQAPGRPARPRVRASAAPVSAQESCYLTSTSGGTPQDVSLSGQQSISTEEQGRKTKLKKPPACQTGGKKTRKTFYRAELHG